MPDDERVDAASSKTEVIPGGLVRGTEDQPSDDSPTVATPSPAVSSADDRVGTDPAVASDPASDTPGAVETTSETATTDGVTEPAPEVTKKRQAKKESFVSKVTELPILLLLAFAIAIIIKTFLVQAFFIPSGSMIPTLQVGDRVLVEKLSYRWGSPSQGDIVVFAKDVFSDGEEPDYGLFDRGRIFFRELIGLPTGAEEDYIKRVVAIGGDSIRYAGSPRRLIVNGKEVDQPYIKDGRDNGSPSLTKSDCKRLDMERAGKGCRVPAGFVFVMGDNRGNSEDSRILGPVDEDKIVGKAFLILWPLRDFGTL